MPITQLELARRLRAARKACHITQARGARVLGIPRSAVSQMETGQRGVSALELHRLAQLYSRDVGGFLEDRFEEGNPVAAMLRAHPELRESPAATASLRLCGEVHREVANLRELLVLDRGISPIPEYSLRAQSRSGMPFNRATPQPKRSAGASTRASPHFPTWPTSWERRVSARSWWTWTTAPPGSL